MKFRYKVLFTNLILLSLCLLYTSNLVEAQANATVFDGGVFIASCDKAMPAMLMSIGPITLFCFSVSALYLEPLFEGAGNGITVVF